MAIRRGQSIRALVRQHKLTERQSTTFGQAVARNIQQMRLLTASHLRTAARKASVDQFMREFASWWKRGDDFDNDDSDWEGWTRRCINAIIYYSLSNAEGRGRRRTSRATNQISRTSGAELDATDERAADGQSHSTQSGSMDESGQVSGTRGNTNVHGQEENQRPTVKKGQTPEVILIHDDSDEERTRRTASNAIDQPKAPQDVPGRTGYDRTELKTIIMRVEFRKQDIWGRWSVDVPLWRCQSPINGKDAAPEDLKDWRNLSYSGLLRHLKSESAILEREIIQDDTQLIVGEPSFATAVQKQFQQILGGARDVITFSIRSAVKSIISSFP